MVANAMVAHNSPTRSLHTRSRLRVERAGPSADDQLLVRLLLQRDAGAMTEIWRRHSSTVHVTARRIVCNDALAQEIVQDVFMTLWNHSARINLDRGNLLTFMKAVTRHRSVDVVRQEVARRRREQRVCDDPGLAAVPGDPIDAVLRIDLIHRVRRAVSDLPGHERASIELAWFADRPYRDVADVLDIPEGTAKTRIRQGLRRLSGGLADDRVFSHASSAN
jgi:RNA polymerase sigma factor (sigma-70 family)